MIYLYAFATLDIVLRECVKIHTSRISRDPVFVIQTNESKDDLTFRRRENREEISPESVFKRKLLSRGI